MARLPGAVATLQPLVRVACGQVVEYWAVRDDLSLLQRLGVVCTQKTHR
jgi:hypothetical protein